MLNQQAIIQQLYHKWVNKTASEQEVGELFNLLRQEDIDTVLSPLLKATWQKENGEYAYDDVRQKAVLAAILAKHPVINERTLKTAHRIHFLRTAWFRYAAAVILLLGIGAYLLWRESSEIPAFGENDKGSVVNSSTSSNNKAILTLADGSQIILDDKTSGNIAQQGNTQIIKLNNNQLTYNSNLKKPGVGPFYNTITTPRGSQYQIILPDGTKAWLNAASSIKIPTTFTGSTRKVEITGEIYFEVSANKTVPFVVIAKGTEVQVLGTSFNINAYDDETPVKTSLLEGSIKVNNRLLSPGEAYLNGKIVATNLQQDIAWKNGIFNFQGLGVKEVMNQLQRWYDIDVAYESGIPDITFYGKMSKTEELSLVLEALKNIGLNFRIQGRTLIVTR